MRPQEVRLECRAGNWVATEDGYAFRPATKTELYLWLKLLELQKNHPTRVFDVRGQEVLKSIEWVDVGSDYKVCPRCGGDQFNGHADNCMLKTVISQ